MKKTRLNPSGFTLVELSFAVLFIAILLLTVALITSQIVGVYRKGVSMKTINQVGRELIEDLRTSITNSPSSFPSTLESHHIYNTMITTLPIYSKEANRAVSTDTNPAELAGVFCTGAYSYIWNTGYRFSSDYTYVGSSHRVDQGIKIKGYPTSSSTDYYPHLLRVTDSSRNVCKNLPSDLTPSTITIDLTNPTFNFSEPVELISSQTDDTVSSTDAPVAIYDLYISNPPARTVNNGRLFYSGSFVLGTTSGGLNITTAGNNCKNDEDENQTYANSNFNYCAVNKFNFAVQSSNSK